MSNMEPCQRRVGPMLEGPAGPYQRICRGAQRTLYVREIEGSKPVGWRRVGRVCLCCHAVELDERRLPYGPVLGL